MVVLSCFLVVEKNHLGNDCTYLITNVWLLKGRHEKDGFLLKKNNNALSYPRVCFHYLWPILTFYIESENI